MMAASSINLSYEPSAEQPWSCRGAEYLVAGQIASKARRKLKILLWVGNWTASDVNNS
jgi:hypothetical protein